MEGFTKDDYPEIPKDLDLEKFTDHPVYARNSNPFADIIINHVIMERSRKHKKKKHPLRLGDPEITFTSKDMNITSRHGQVVSKDGDLIIGDKRWEDEEGFVKIYKDLMGYFYDLSGTASRIYIYLMQYVNQDSTLVSFDVQDMVEDLNLTKATLYKGLNELLNRHFLKKTDRTHMVHINPIFIFNGKRMVIMHEIALGDKEKAKQESSELLNYSKPKVLTTGDKDYDKEELDDDVFGE